MTAPHRFLSMFPTSLMQLRRILCRLYRLYTYLDASVSDASVEVSVDEAAAGDTADVIDTDFEMFLRDSRHQDLLLEIGVSAFQRMTMLKEVTYGNYVADDVDIFVPTAGVAVPVGRQGFTVGDRSHLASEFLRVGFNIDGFSDEFLRDGFSDVSCAEGFLNNIRNLAAADQGVDFSDVSSVASWSSGG